MIDQFPELSLNDAKNLYAKFAGQDDDQAVRVMAGIALTAKHQQAG
jgi:hypothetical protein